MPNPKHAKLTSGEHKTIRSDVVNVVQQLSVVEEFEIGDTLNLAGSTGHYIKKNGNDLEIVSQGKINFSASSFTGLPSGNGGGTAGSKGEKGQAGTNGTNGANGTNGTNGDKGQKGEPGSGGSGSGDKGQKGQAGTNGTNGANGTNGTNGTNGDKGQKGEIGNNGADADKGEKGVKGVKGEVGNNGADADKGQKGEPGTGGSSFDGNLKGDLTVSGNTTLKGELNVSGATSLSNNAMIIESKQISKIVPYSVDGAAFSNPTIKDVVLEWSLAAQTDMQIKEWTKQTFDDNGIPYPNKILKFNAICISGEENFTIEAGGISSGLITFSRFDLTLNTTKIQLRAVTPNYVAGSKARVSIEYISV